MDAITEFKIEKGVPLPPRRGGGKPIGLGAILRQMEIGDSVLVPGGKQDAITGSTGSIQRRTSMKFATRIVDGGVRIWRIV